MNIKIEKVLERDIDLLVINKLINGATALDIPIRSTKIYKRILDKTIPVAV